MAAIDDEKTGEREVAFCGERVDGVFERAVGKGRELVEQRHQPARGDILQGQHEHGGRDPRPEPCIGIGIKEPDQQGHERQTDGRSEDQPLHRIHDKSGGRGLVEAVLRLDAESVVH